MYTDKTEEAHIARLERDRVLLSQRTAFIKLGGQALLFLALAPIGVAIWLISTYDVDMTRTVDQLLALGLFLILIACLIGASHAFAISGLWQRELKHNQVRFDVHQAVDDALREVLGRHIPGFRSNVTELNLSEELLREVNFQCQRRVKIARGLQSLEQNKDVSLAVAVDRFIAESLKARDSRYDREAIEEFLRTFELELEDEKLIHFPSPSS